MIEELNKLLEDFRKLEHIWSNEEKNRIDESGKKYALGVSNGFRHAAIALNSIVKSYGNIQLNR
ncbi:hypothetical protein NLX71_02430 [Paenibacillus sp. MZ04-78.2]|uniref:hypothetical protein n=1 Tax=Paenibacillus sp. MZ04-78.2 TaxID=2962034 RepID=UPI0020B8D379|nr:hypothetical protein [Paenibacillus sp. MZ04-78.2]MCP3772176.1 hypothetical protein [Paenibacillus sp. MZ04-78.2]